MNLPSLAFDEQAARRRTRDRCHPVGQERYGNANSRGPPCRVDTRAVPHPARHRAWRRVRRAAILNNYVTAPAKLDRLAA
jgi:hypothetical protein